MSPTTILVLLLSQFPRCLGIPLTTTRQEPHPSRFPRPRLAATLATTQLSRPGPFPRLREATQWFPCSPFHRLRPVQPIPQAPGNSPDYYPGSPPQPIPQAPVTVPGGDHPHHAGHGPDSATGDRPQGEHSQHGSVPNIPEVDQPAAILF